MSLELPFLNRRPKTQNPEAGLYSYQRQHDEDRTHVHLRIHPEGDGLLMVNANRAVHLNPTAVIMAWLLLEGESDHTILSQLTKQYHVSRGTAKQDLDQLRRQIDELIRPGGACPIHELDLDVLAPFSKIPQAPYRMDLALTYRCNCDCAHCYNARPRSYPEISTKEWKGIIETLWKVGVPHICFTGGEATLREDLPELITFAQTQGQITGLLTNGRRLSDEAYVEKLTKAGLDHVQITIESFDPAIHDQMVGARGAWRQTIRGIENALKSNLFVMTNTTLLQLNAPHITETIDFLADLGVPTIGCNALIYAGAGKSVGTGLKEDELAPLLETVRARTEARGQRLIWYTPTQYCHFDPVQMELGVKGCTAATYNMCVEPNGDVIPCQSYYQTIGNLIQDPWNSIWQHELALWLRERKYIPDDCNECPVLRECGGGCPLSLSHQSPIVQISVNAL